MIVVDAVTLAYLLLRHPRFSGEVRRAADLDAEWCAPPLWRSELRSTLMQYVRATDRTIPGSGLTLAGAVARMDRAERLISGRSFEVRSPEVLHLADRSGLSPYDCEYVALAQGLDTKLLTYDKPVLKAFPEIAVRPSDFAG